MERHSGGRGAERHRGGTGDADGGPGASRLPHEDSGRSEAADSGELLELWRYYRERVEDPLERTLLCNAAILRDSCYCQGEAVYGDELEALRDLTPGEMEDLLLRLAEGEALPEERGGTFDLQRFADMKGE